MSISAHMPTIHLLIQKVSSPAALSASSSLRMSCLYIGGFLSPPIVTPLALVFPDAMSARIVVGTVFSVVFGIIALFADFR